MSIERGSRIVVVSSLDIRAAILPDRTLRINTRSAGLLRLAPVAQEQLAAIFGIAPEFLGRLVASDKHQPLAAQTLNHFFQTEPRRLKFRLRDDLIEVVEPRG